MYSDKKDHKSSLGGQSLSLRCTKHHLKWLSNILPLRSEFWDVRYYTKHDAATPVTPADHNLHYISTKSLQALPTWNASTNACYHHSFHTDTNQHDTYSQAASSSVRLNGKPTICRLKLFSGCFLDALNARKADQKSQIFSLWKIWSKLIRSISGTG